jgi:hypothetical protein
MHLASMGLCRPSSYPRMAGPEDETARVKNWNAASLTTVGRCHVYGQAKVPRASQEEAVTTRV